MAAALRSGIEVTSLNHRYPDDDPRILFMRIAARGAEDKLSRSVTMGRWRTASISSRQAERPLSRENSDCKPEPARGLCWN